MAAAGTAAAVDGTGAVDPAEADPGVDRAAAAAAVDDRTGIAPGAPTVRARADPADPAAIAEVPTIRRLAPVGWSPALPEARRTVGAIAVPAARAAAAQDARVVPAEGPAAAPAAASAAPAHVTGARVVPVVLAAARGVPAAGPALASARALVVLARALAVPAAALLVPAEALVVSAEALVVPAAALVVPAEGPAAIDAAAARAAPAVRTAAPAADAVPRSLAVAAVVEAAARARKVPGATPRAGPSPSPCRPTKRPRPNPKPQPRPSPSPSTSSGFAPAVAGGVVSPHAKVARASFGGYRVHRNGGRGHGRRRHRVSSPKGGCRSTCATRRRGSRSPAS